MMKLCVLALITFGTILAKDFSLAPSNDNDDYSHFQEKRCPIGCLTCSELNGCESCEKGHTLFLNRFGLRQTGECLTRCPPGYQLAAYGEGAKICARCYLSFCDECGKERSKCLKCRPPYKPINGVCETTKNCSKEQGNELCQNVRNCIVGEWSSWSTCSHLGKFCGFKYGTRTRIREEMYKTVKNKYKMQCPATMQTKRCLLTHRKCRKSRKHKHEKSEASRIYRYRHNHRAASAKTL